MNTGGDYGRRIKMAREVRGWNQTELATRAGVASRLGHADPGITLRAYTVSDTDATQKADRLTDEYLGGGFPDGFPDP